MQHGRKMNKHQIHRQHSGRKQFIALFALILLLLLPACSGDTPTFGNKFNLGSIWDVPTEEGVAIWDNATEIAVEQHSGYLLGEESLSKTQFTEIASGEGNREDDIQVMIRDMVEEEEIVALVGATTNEASMRAASLANFFNVPMIIPGADGELVLQETNLWAFRLSAPSSAYANFLFNDIFGNPVLENRIDPTRLKIAILYEQNTFGESAAVATATDAMAQLIEIGAYTAFSVDALDTEKIAAMVTDVMDEQVDLVYIVSNAPDMAIAITQEFADQAQEGGTLPILVGQAGGFASLEFLQSEQAEDVIVLRQKMETDQCPAEVESLYEAQSYAAVYLLDAAVQQAKSQSLQVDTSFITNLFSNSAVDPMAKFRETVRDVLKESNQYVPCLGNVSFDNNGQNKNLQFELVTTKNGSNQIYSVEDFLNEVNVFLGDETP